MKYNRKDCSNHKYNIPEDRLARFDELQAQVDSADEYSDEWYDANDYIDYEFGKFMVCGHAGRG